LECVIRLSLLLCCVRFIVSRYLRRYGIFNLHYSCVINAGDVLTTPCQETRRHHIFAPPLPNLNRFLPARRYASAGISDHPVSVRPRVGPGYPLPPLLLPCPFTSSSFALYYFFPFSFSHSLYLFSSIVHPIPFYQNSPTPFPGERS